MKKIISILVTLIILEIGIVLAASGDSSTENTYQDGYNAGYKEGYSDGADNVYKPKEPNIIIINQETIPTANAGGNFNLTIEYKNDSEHTAKSVKITPIFENVPLVYERPITFETTKSLKRNGTNTATFSFKVKDNAKNGVYPMNFKLEYKNNSSENFSKTEILYFKVIGEKMKSIVTVNNVVTEPSQVKAGESFILKFDIHNIGDIPMKESSVKLTGLATDGFMPMDSTDFSYIGTIDAKSSVTRTFNMIASSNISSGNNTLGVNVHYVNENDEAINEEKNLYILNVLNDKKEDKKEEESTTSSKPKIIIESYSTMPNSIIAGDSFVFNFKFKNTSREMSIKNMKITISSTEGAFMIANGSNTFYVEKMGAQGVMTNSIKLNVKQDLASKSYPIHISFDYEDEKNNAYQAEEIINIPVTEYSNLVINNVMAGQAIVDQQTSLSFDYINMGKAVVSNLTASVEGDYEAVQSINYIGNLEAGNSDYYDIQVTPTKEGENVGILVLTFEDSSGKKIEIRKEFTGYAMLEPTFDDQGGFDDPIISEDIESNTLSTWQYIAIGVGSFAICFIISKIITTKIVRKKLEDEI